MSSTISLAKVALFTVFVWLAACDAPTDISTVAAPPTGTEVDLAGPSLTIAPDYSLDILTFEGRATGFKAVNRRGVIAGSAAGVGPVLYDDGEWSVLPGGFSARTRDINAAGQVVGYIRPTGEQRAVFWDTSGEMTDLGPGFAASINDAGQVAGFSCNGTCTAFVWEDGVMRLLDDATVGAHDISARGEVVGHMIGAGGFAVAFSWKDGQLTPLPTLGGVSTAFGVNIGGQVVGVSFTADGISRAVLWEGGTIRDLGLPGRSRAIGVNDLGQVVGWSGPPGEPPTAFIWQNGAYAALPRPDGGGTTIAEDINNLGLIAGQSVGAFAPSTRGVIWEPEWTGRGGGPP